MRTKILIVVTAFILTAGVIGAVIAINRPKNPLPTHVAKQINYGVFYPDNKDKVTIDKKSYSYNPSEKQLTYNIRYNNQDLIISEQPTPDQFIDIPDYFPKLLEKMKNYASFENAVGKVYLTRPTEINNQVAVMSSKGTLIFVRSQHDMDTNYWRDLFNSLEFVQPH